MDRQIPSSAFLNIGQRLIAIEPRLIAIEPRLIAIEPRLVVTREPIVIGDDHHDVSVYDILREWASLLIEYFGEYI
jgi:hypothetical protein